MSWPQKTCKNCKHISYSLKMNKVCPFCDPEIVFEKIIKKAQDALNTKENLTRLILKLILKYNVDKDQLKNRILSTAAFHGDETIRLYFSELIKELEL